MEISNFIENSMLDFIYREKENSLSAYGIRDFIEMDFVGCTNDDRNIKKIINLYNG